jgi:hypothetical protein
MIGSYKRQAVNGKRHRRIYSGGAMIGSYKRNAGNIL